MGGAQSSPMIRLERSMTREEGVWPSSKFVRFKKAYPSNSEEAFAGMIDYHRGKDNDRVGRKLSLST